MAETVHLIGQPRQTRGSRLARRLRGQGLIPAVLYGHKEQTLTLAVSMEELSRTIRQGTRVVDLEAGGKTDKALIKEVQWDHLGLEILHVDFNRVSADERIVIEVRLEIRGTAPGVATGGVVDQPLHNIKVECPALSPPESIRVNIGELQLGQAIHVKDIKLPDGVVALTDSEAIVVHVTQKVVVEEAAPVVAAPTTAEPEVIGRKPSEEKEEAAEK
jgi:large subunit ribosomal protein L25